MDFNGGGGDEVAESGNSLFKGGLDFGFFAGLSGGGDLSGGRLGLLLFLFSRHLVLLS